MIKHHNIDDVINEFFTIYYYRRYRQLFSIQNNY